MTIAEDYWSSYEGSVESVGDFLDAVQKISEYEAATGSQFAWRGVSDASWPMYSSLARYYVEQREELPTERQLRELERQVVREAREWALDWHASGGRLSGVELLAALQHFGTPTRLIDFS